MRLACARQQVRRARFFLIENSATRDFDKQNLSRARGELPKLIILSVAFRRAVARIDSWTLEPISHPSNDPSLEILNSPFNEASLRVTDINFHLLSTIDMSRHWKPCQSSTVDITRGIRLFTCACRELQVKIFNAGTIVRQNSYFTNILVQKWIL